MRCSIRRKPYFEIWNIRFWSVISWDQIILCMSVFNKFSKIFLDDSFIPGKSEKTLGAHLQSFSWTIKYYSSGIRRFELNQVMSKACPFFPHSIEQGRISLKLPGRKSCFKSVMTQQPLTKQQRYQQVLLQLVFSDLSFYFSIKLLRTKQSQVFLRKV